MGLICLHPEPPSTLSGQSQCSHAAAKRHPAQRERSGPGGPGHPARPAQGILALEARREEHHLHPRVKKEAALLAKPLAAHLEKIEAEIATLLAASAQVKARVERLTQVVGVGAVSAYTLLAHLPELGKLSRGAIAALAGVASTNADSGPMRGQRHIRGGRAPARKALYMATLCATLHNPLIKTYYKALRAKGKPAKVALTAVMRKLLLHLNFLLKTPTAKLS